MKQHLQAIWRVIVETLFPAFCLGCRVEGLFLCDACLSTLRQSDGIFQKDAACFALDGVLAACSYDENPLLQRSIHALKYEFVRDLATPLGSLLADALPDMHDVVLCPVPLHVRRRRWRGFNQAHLLAEETGRKTGLPVRKLLRRTRFARPQMELTRLERLRNVQESFEIAEETTHIPVVVLVDDVATTLATLEACATVLKRAGVPRVYGIVLARVY